ncbi:fungal-specific transcription factor domain-containing protein [Xylariales sp. PMI_506]|nr:fungal-specific transcription factor domain-containing protein [Xylariales sp. PMI_506]
MEQPSPRRETKRKHVTTACDACRGSKVKCDGETPACSSCVSKGRDCRYQAREDKRKVSLRVAIGLLSCRVQQLSQFIDDNGLVIPSMPSRDENTLSGILRALGLPQPALTQDSRDCDSSSTQGSPTDHRLDHRLEHEVQIQHRGVTAVSGPNIPSMPPLKDDEERPPTAAMRGLLELANAAGDTGAIMQTAAWDWSMAADSMPQSHMMQPGSASVPVGTGPAAVPGDGSTPSHRQSISGGESTCASSELETGIGASESNDELVDQISDRVGTLHIRPGGYIRFYGSTSNFNLLEGPATDVSMNVYRTIRNDGSEYLERLGLSKDVPPEIEDHLMNLYFTWQDPSFHAVDRVMFEEAKAIWYDKGEDTSYYSEALRNAICALGAAFDARHHPAFVTFPRSLADFFADRAKALLEIELDSPSVATIQALVLLSAHDIGCGRDARGWLYSGMAMRLSFNLALHHDLTPYIIKGVVTAAEADLRRTVFWAAYVADHIWSFYLGQPFRMSMKGVHLDKPGPKNPLRLPGQWSPYFSPTSTQPFVPMADCVEEVCRYQILLFEAMAPLSDTLYGSEAISKKVLQEQNAAIVKKILDWKNDLPVELRVDLHDHETTYLPHVLLLHMQYYQSLIYAHRPWMSKVHVQPQPPQGPGYGHARMMCMDSAIAIAQLFRLYEERYTLRRINIQAVAIAFSAALLLVFATVARYQRDGEDEILADLSVCFRALDELAPSWETAKRAHDFLIRLQRHWERRARANSLAAATWRDDAGSTISGGSNSRKSQRGSIRSNEESRPTHLRDDAASSLQQRGYWGEGGVVPEFGMDIDFDWLLTTSTENMPGNRGNIFSVQSGTAMPG